MSAHQITYENNNPPSRVPISLRFVCSCGVAGEWHPATVFLDGSATRAAEADAARHLGESS